MFEHFDSALFSDPSFKEDSVREVIIAPMLAKLGYHPTGEDVVVRSKSLVHPFIYVGTRRHPVTIIPDYTLYSRGQALLVLDAKSPSESVDSRAHIQQAYSYAIHPEIRSTHFALCNGRRLVVFSVLSPEPLLSVPFKHFEDHWDEIEKHLGPKYLREPILRKFAPDLGVAITRMGFDPNAEHILIGAKLGLFGRVSDSLYTASVNTRLADVDHCASFDFTPEKLPLLVSGLLPELREQFLGALGRSPFQAHADLLIEVDIHCRLGEKIEVEYESFVPFVITSVMSSRFNPISSVADQGDIPDRIFRLSKAFTIVSKPPDV